MKEFTIKVNQNVEFMNSILMTSNYNRITEPPIGYRLMEEDLNEYTSAVMSFFEMYRNNDVYQFIESLIPNGFTFSRPVELMLCMGNSDDFILQRTPSKLCIDYCGGMTNIFHLLDLLRAFSHEIRYCNFFENHMSYYDPIIERIDHMVHRFPFITVLEEEYGKEQGSYTYVPSALMRGNYGIQLIDDATQKTDIFSVFYTNNYSLSPAVLFHEFSHPFINPLTEKYSDNVKYYKSAYNILAAYRLPGYTSGYGDWEECVNEHFVRAMVIHLLKKCGLTEDADEMLRNDLNCGYKFIPLILEQYTYYDKKRSIYPDFEAFYPELLNVFCNTSI